jgi:membrane protein involved in colicin uptake
MSKRYAVLGLSVVLALALAVPALGGPSNPVASISATAKQIAKKALKRANEAQATAVSAQNAANAAQSDATKALNEAKKAQTSANTAQSTANTALSTANAAKAAADAANANANTRVKDSHEIFGTASASNTVTSKFSSADCPSTEPVLGGGFFVGGEQNLVTISSSDAQIYGHGWFASGNAIGAATPTWSITAVVMCGTK